MSKTLTWPQWLNVIARNITIESPYICCHIDGGYLATNDVKNPSKTYLDAISGKYASFRAKLENEINKEVDALNAAHPYDHSPTLSRKLGYPHEGGVKGRQDWLRSLKNI